MGVKDRLIPTLISLVSVNFRIVLFDTLIDQMEDEEIEAVLAHEIGHYKLGHIPKRLLLSFLTGLFAFYGLSLVLVTSLGYGRSSITLKFDWFTRTYIDSFNIDLTKLLLTGFLLCPISFRGNMSTRLIVLQKMQ